MQLTIVADYHDTPAEGINVVSKTLVDDLVALGHAVTLVPPDSILHRLPGLVLRPPKMIVFTHGPGPRTVLASRILRRLTASRIVWIATRPDLATCPGWLRGGKSAHAIVTNRHRKDLAEVATDARTVQQAIGIAPERLSLAGGATPGLWPEVRRKGVPLAVHVGHLRRNRGLEQFVAIKQHLGDRIDLVVQASPYFEPAAGLTEELREAGVHVVRKFVPDIAAVYRSADLYLFPAPPEQEGAIDLPLSVLEAMACQTPVISTPFGALPTVLKDEPGITFSGSQEFARAVETWVATPAAERARPAGLPDRLNAHRLADRVVELMEN